MKNIKIRGYHWFIMLAWLAIAALDAQLATVQAQGTAFTYQGQLPVMARQVKLLFVPVSSCISRNLGVKTYHERSESFK